MRNAFKEAGIIGVGMAIAVLLVRTIDRDLPPIAALGVLLAAGVILGAVQYGLLVRRIKQRRNLMRRQHAREQAPQIPATWTGLNPPPQPARPLSASVTAEAEPEPAAESAETNASR